MGDVKENLTNMLLYSVPPRENVTRVFARFKNFKNLSKISLVPIFYDLRMFNLGFFLVFVAITTAIIAVIHSDSDVTILLLLYRYINFHCRKFFDFYICLSII